MQFSLVGRSPESSCALLVALCEKVYDPSRGSRSTLYSATKPHAPTSDQCRRDDFFHRSSSYTRTEAMTTYSQLKAYVKQLGGSDGPAGIGCINLTGGTEIQITHNPPGAGTRVVSVVPYMVGADKTSGGNP